MKVIIIMGSHQDLDFAKSIESFIRTFEIETELRIASAHKTPLKVLEILEKNKDNNVIYITIAGRSNALSAFIDANTSQPVIACPPLGKEKFDPDLYSSLSMPSGVAPLFIKEPQNAALAAIKIFALQNKDLKKRIDQFHQDNRQLIEEKDKELTSGKC